jgi:hypothetical protein
MRTLLTLFLCCSFYLSDAQVIADAGSDQKRCLNDQLVLSGSGLAQGDTGSFQWKNLNSGQVVSGTSDYKVLLKNSGQYTFELLVTRITNGNTFSDTDTVTVIVNGLPLIQIDVPDTVCSGSSTFALNNISPAGAVGTWSGIGVTGRNFNPGISPKTTLYSGPVMLKFSYTDPVTGCPSADSQSLLIQTAPGVSINTAKPYRQCEGRPFNLSATPKWTQNIRWTTNGDGSFSASTSPATTYTHGINDTSTGNLIISVTTLKEGSCPPSQDNISLVIEPYPQFTMPGHLVACEPAIFQFTPAVRKPFSSPNLRYSWWFGNGDSLVNSSEGQPANIMYDSAKQGWYDVRIVVHNKWGSKAGEVCSVQRNLPGYVKVLPQPRASFTSNPVYYTTTSSPEFTFINKTSVRWGAEKMKYLWYFDTRTSNDTSTKKDPVHRYPSDTANYWVNMIATYHFTDGLTQTEYTCQDSTSQPRKVGNRVTDLTILTVDQNKAIRLLLPFNGTLEVFDANGKLVEKRTEDNALFQDFDIGPWACGTYIFVVTNDKERKSMKFLKY